MTIKKINCNLCGKKKQLINHDIITNIVYICNCGNLTNEEGVYVKEPEKEERILNINEKGKVTSKK